VDLTLADVQIDPLEDLVLAVGDRGNAEPADDEALLGRG
jgi:hypothetical protein